MKSWQQFQTKKYLYIRSQDVDLFLNNSMQKHFLKFLNWTMQNVECELDIAAMFSGEYSLLTKLFLQHVLRN